MGWNFITNVHTLSCSIWLVATGHIVPKTGQQYQAQFMDSCNAPGITTGFGYCHATIQQDIKDSIACMSVTLEAGDTD